MFTHNAVFKKFCLAWLSAFLLLLSCAVSLNYLIDPYGMFDMQRITGINAIKPAAGSHVRLAKPYQVVQFDPRTIIAGNSRPEMGLNPRNTCWPENHMPVFNLSFPGASVYMQARMIQHAVSLEKVGLVLWGLDLLDFLDTHERKLSSWEDSRKRPDIEKRLTVHADGTSNKAYSWEKAKDYWLTLLSLDTVKDSIRTLLSQNNQHASSVRRDGFNPARDYMDIIAWEGQNVLFKQKNTELEKIFSRPGLKLYHSNPGWSHKFESVRRIIEFNGQHDVRTVLFINPYHADYLTAVKSSGHWADFVIWKEALTSLSDSFGVELWDFSGINSFSTEKVPPLGDKKSILKWFWEPAHYRKEYGDIMLSRMLNKDCQSLLDDISSVGVQLTDGKLLMNPEQVNLGTQVKKQVVK